eukprot:COSAG01_NODE_8462_length_2777_cov_3.963032_4_plen_161_part_00
MQRGIGPGDCVENAASRTAICYAWRSDNQGPHAYDEALGIFQSVQKMFQNATVEASDAFDDFIAAVEPFKEQLPLVTAEIGDTWSECVTTAIYLLMQHAITSPAACACSLRARVQFTEQAPILSRLHCSARPAASAPSVWQQATASQHRAAPNSRPSSVC